MIWLMKILKIYHEEQLLIKFSEIKHLILLKTQSMMDVKKVLLLWFIIFFFFFFDKKSAKGGSVNNAIKQNAQLAEELHKPIIKTF